jgi:hypothetical protein
MARTVKVHGQKAQDQVLFHPIDFGMLTICCPTCKVAVHGVMVATAFADKVEVDTDDPLETIVPIGIVAYPCSHVFMTPCLMEKCVRLIDAYERGQIRVSMLVDLIHCDEHGVDFPGLS